MLLRNFSLDRQFKWHLKVIPLNSLAHRYFCLSSYSLILIECQVLRETFEMYLCTFHCPSPSLVYLHFIQSSHSQQTLGDFVWTHIQLGFYMLAQGAIIKIATVQARKWWAKKEAARGGQAHLSEHNMSWSSIAQQYVESMETIVCGKMVSYSLQMTVEERCNTTEVLVL